MSKIRKAGYEAESMLYAVADYFGDSKEGWQQLAVEMVKAMTDTQAKEVLSYIAKNWEIDFLANISDAKDFSASTKKSKIIKSEGITSKEVEDIDRSFEQDGWDVSGWVEPSSKLGFTRPWWIIRDVNLSDFVALQRITDSVIPTKFQCGIDYEFTDYGNNGVYLNFLIPYVEDYSASTKKSKSDWKFKLTGVNGSEWVGTLDETINLLRESLEMMNLPWSANPATITLELLDDDYSASAKKSYTPDYQDFRSMVKSIKNTGNHNKVFKE